MTRVNPVGWFIVAFFLIGGIFFWITLPSIGIGQIWTGVAAFLALVYLGIRRRGQKAQQIRETGIPGRATILEATQTGMYINEQPQVKLKMQVEATGIPSYQLEKRVTVPLIALGVLGSGQPLTVHVDPNDHDNVVIDWAPAGALAGVAAGPMAAPMTFSFPDGTTADISGNEAAKKEVLDVLTAHGLSPHGTLDLRSNPHAREAVLGVLSRYGYGPEANQAAAGGAPVAAGGAAVSAAEIDDDKSGVERLMELQQMRDKGLITEKEFEENKTRILKSL